MPRPILLVLAVFFIFKLSDAASHACSEQADISAKPYKPTAPLRKVMIVAYTKNYENRTMFEKELEYRLGVKGYSAVASVRIQEDTHLPGREEILEMLTDNNLDGVAVMRLVDVSTEEGYSRSTRSMSDPFAPFYFHTYYQAYANIYSMDLIIDRQVVLELRLFETSSEKMIHRHQESMTNAESVETLAGTLTEKFSRDLKKSRLLQKKTSQ